MATRSSSGRCALISMRRLKIAPVLLRFSGVPGLGRVGLQLVADVAVEQGAVLGSLVFQGDSHPVAPVACGVLVLADEDDPAGRAEEIAAQGDLQVEHLAERGLESGGDQEASAAQGEHLDGGAL